MIVHCTAGNSAAHAHGLQSLSEFYRKWDPTGQTCALVQTGIGINTTILMIMFAGFLWQPKWHCLIVQKGLILLYLLGDPSSTQVCSFSLGRASVCLLSACLFMCLFVWFFVCFFMCPFICPHPSCFSSCNLATQRTKPSAVSLMLFRPSSLWLFCIHAGIESIVTQSKFRS